MEEKILNDAVLCYLVDPTTETVCLPLKKLKICKGCLNGYGGGIEPGQTPLEAALTELFQESGGITADAKDLKKVAIIEFHNEELGGGFWICKVHVYLTMKWKGIPRETSEMGPPQWFSIDNLPYDRLMPGDSPWLGLVLNGEKVYAEVNYSPLLEESGPNQRKWHRTALRFIGSFSESEALSVG